MAQGSHSPSPTTSRSTPPTVHSGAGDNDNFDDIWGTPPRSLTLANDTLQSSIPSDIPRLRTTHTTAGYRDGAALARGAAVQPGFDEGHLLGAAIGIRAGYLIGVVEGMEVGCIGNAATILHDEVAAITKELKVESLLGKEWIAEDGTWKWEVDAQSEEDATIAEVANSHPHIIRWSRKIGALMQAAGVQRKYVVSSVSKS
jgi:hypothetical protein